MIEFYPQIKLVHVFCVLLSGTLFLLRGTGVLAGARWPARAGRCGCRCVWRATPSTPRC